MLTLSFRFAALLLLSSMDGESTINKVVHSQWLLYETGGTQLHVCWGFATTYTLRMLEQG